MPGGQRRSRRVTTQLCSVVFAPPHPLIIIVRATCGPPTPRDARRHPSRRTGRVHTRCLIPKCASAGRIVGGNRVSRGARRPVTRRVVAAHASPPSPAFARSRPRSRQPPPSSTDLSACLLSPARLQTTTALAPCPRAHLASSTPTFSLTSLSSTRPPTHSKPPKTSDCSRLRRTRADSERARVVVVAATNPPSAATKHPNTHIQKPWPPPPTPRPWRRPTTPRCST